MVHIYGIPADKKDDPDVIKEMGENKASQSAVNDEIAAQLSMSDTIKHLKSDTVSLLTNVTYIFTVLAIIGDGLIVTGFTAFGPKYLENQFSLTASVAGGLFGKMISSNNELT